MKKSIALAILSVFAISRTFGAVTITPASGGGAISADSAATAPGAAWSPLGAIVVTEGPATPHKSDFSTGTNVTLVLKAPAGFEFNTNSILSIGATGGDITSTAVVLNDAATLTATFTVSTTANRDALTIGGLQVRPTAGSPLAAGFIYRPTAGGSAVIKNIAASSNVGGSGGSNFGALVEVGGEPVSVAIATQPSTNAMTLQPFVQQPVIELRDQFNNISTGNNSAVVNAAGSSALVGSTSVTVTNGVAAFTNLAASAAGTLTIDFSSGSLPVVTSDLIDVLPAPATPAALVISTEPSATATAGAVFAQQPVVSIYDQYGNPFTNDNVTVVTAARFDGAGTLQGTLTATVVEGVASFTDLSHTVAGEITIEFTAAGLSNAFSQTITVSAVAADHLVFTTQPAGAIAGLAFATQPVVKAQDQFGNDSTVDLPANLVVTLALTNSAGVLSGTATADIGTAAGNGTASFSGLSIDLAGLSNQLIASANGLADAVSDAFNVAPFVPTKLVISTQPSSNAVAGVAFAQQPVVRIEDANGNLAVADNTTVVTVSRGTGTAALQGTLQATAVNGVAIFTDLSYNRAETITLSFTSAALTAATSDSILVDPAAAAALVFTTQPAGAYAGAAFLTQPVVQARDIFGNNSTVGLATNHIVSLSLTAGSGALIGTATVDIGTGAGNGAGAFADVGVSAAGLNKQVTASASGLADASSASFIAGGVEPLVFNVSADTAVSGFTTIAGPIYYEGRNGDVGVGEIILNAPAGYEFDTGGTAPTVRIQKISGGGNTGNIQGQGVPSGGANSAVWPVTSVTTTQIVFTVTSVSSGVADSLTWQNIRIRAVDGATLTSGNLTKTGTSVMATVVDGVTSFGTVQTTVGSAHHLVIETHASGTAVAGAAFAQQPLIRLEDQYNRLVTNDSTSVVVATINQGTSGLQGVTSVTVVNGYATFADLAYNIAETITIDFTAGALASVTSDAIVVSPAAADQLVFTVQPGAAVSGVPFGVQPVLKTYDQFGNLSAVDLPANLDVTVSLTTGSGVLGGTTTVDIGTAAGNGTATFTDLQIDGADANNQITAVANGLTAAVSDVFAVTTADHLEYVDGDGQTGAAGNMLPVNPTVRVVDINGVPVAGVLVSFNIVSGGGSVGASAVITDTNGLASTAFTLGPIAGESNNVVTASALVPGNPASVTFYASVAGGVPAQLAIVTQPSATAEAGVVFAQQPQVRIEDEFGNVLTNDNTTVVTVTRGVGLGVLQGTLTATAVDGIATFTDLSHNVAGTIDLSFSAIGLAGTNSTAIEITPAAVSQVAFTVQPGNARTDSPLNPQPVIRTQDQFGNNSTNGLPENLEVALALSAGTGDLLGTTNLDLGSVVGNGIAAFTNLQVAVGGIGKQITASATGLVEAVSTAFRIGGVEPATMPIISSDGAFVSVTGPAYYELVSGDIAVGTIILNAPVGYEFDTNSPVSVVIRRIAGKGNPDNNINQAHNGAGTSFATTLTPTQITFVVTSSSTNGVVNSLTWQGIRVGAAVGIPAAESHITKTGTSAMAVVEDGVTSFGEVVGEARPVRLVIETQPSATATAGVAFLQQPVVRVEDQFGNLWTSNSVLVTAARVSGSGDLQGTLSVASVNGFATFSDLAHNVAGAITIGFSNPELVAATSSNVVVSAAQAYRLVFTAQPGSAVYNQVFGAQPAVKTTDAFGNNSTVGLPPSLNVSIRLGSGTGTLQGTTVLDIGTAAGNGAVAFSNLSVNAAGEKELVAEAIGLQSATSASFTIAKANQTITFGPLPNKAYGDAPFALNATATSGLSVTYSVESGPAIVSGNSVTITGTGVVTIRASQGGDANYNAAQAVDQSFAVSIGSQIIAFAVLTNKTLGDAPFTVTATASSGLPVSFSIVSGPATIAGSTITCTNVGVVTVRASQAGNSNYTAAADVDQSFDVIGHQTITFGALAQKVVTDAPFTVSATASSGLPVSFSIVSGPATISSNLITLTGAGRVTVRASQEGNEVYHPANPVNQSFWVRSGVLLPGDLDESGQADILVQNTNGVITVFLMDKTNSLESAVIREGTPVAAGWTVVGQGDLNDDGQNDLLFQHDQGRLAVWFLNGTNYVGAQALKNDLPVKEGWRAVCLSDFNGDGKADILFQHADRRLSAWLMNGTSLIRAKLLNDGLPLREGWKAAVAPDVNANAKGDIVFQHADGRMAVWFMSGFNKTGTGMLQQGPAAATGWKVVGCGDLDRDGKADLLWQDGSGNVATWFLNGTSYISSGSVSGITLDAGSSIVGAK